MAAITGLTANTKKNIQLDAGALFKNYVPGTDTPATASAKLIGATEGGSVIGITGEVRQIAVDGAKGPTKGLEVIDGWTATLSTTIKETCSASVQLALGAATVTTSTSPSGYVKVTPNADFTDNDYIGNVTWVGKIVGAANPMMIVLKNVASLNGLQFTVQDKGEGSVPVTLTAHYDVANLDTAPVEIYMPTVSTN